MINFIKKYYQFIVLGGVFVFLLIFCFSNLTTRPSIWDDEALNIEAAHNFLLFGKLDIQTAPGVFSNASYSLVTSNYPLGVPLAGFFYLFGFGAVQARIFMILWLFIAVGAIYLFTRSFFSDLAAIVAVLLVVSFASFFGNGMTVTGEIPGFVFLLAGLYYLIKKDNYLLGGLLLGLAVASKPSVYLLLLPAVFIYILYLRKDIIIRLLKFAAGSFGPIFLYALFIIPNALSSLNGWTYMLEFYQNPYVGAPSLWANMISNIFRIPLESTLLYFSLLFIIIVFAFFRFKKDLPVAGRLLMTFFFFYGFFQFIYFLRSPGWVRYLFSLELLSLILVFPSLSLFLKKRWAFLVCLFLIFIQAGHLFLGADLSSSKRPEEVSSFVNSQPAKSVGIINLPLIAAFIPPEKKYHVMMDLKQEGENPLSFAEDKLPDLIVFVKRAGSDDGMQYQNVLDNQYTLIKEFGMYKVAAKNLK